jgi:hypothetical protein
VHPPLSVTSQEVGVHDEPKPETGKERM